MPEPTTRRLIPFALGFALLAVSTASIFIRFAQQEAPSLVIAAGRLAIASLVLAAPALARHREEIRRLGRRDLALAVLSGLALALHFATWITSLEHTSVTSSVVLVTTTPLWVALATPLLLKEKLSRPVVAGMILALAGGVVVGLGDSCSWAETLHCPPPSTLLAGKGWGNFLALAGAWSAAAYLLIGRRLRGRISLVPYIFLVYGIAAVILIVWMFAAGETPFGYSPMTYVWILLLALVPQLIGHSTYNWALRFLSATLVAVTALGEPIGSSILAYIFLKETPGWITAAGAAVILGGIVLAARGEQAGE
jgi:drug/metabolite transporter (DMT)-like permease